MRPAGSNSWTPQRVFTNPPPSTSPGSSACQPAHLHRRTTAGRPAPSRSSATASPGAHRGRNPCAPTTCNSPRTRHPPAGTARAAQTGSSMQFGGRHMDVVVSMPAPGAGGPWVGTWRRGEQVTALFRQARRSYSGAGGDVWSRPRPWGRDMATVSALPVVSALAHVRRQLPRLGALALWRHRLSRHRAAAVVPKRLAFENGGRRYNRSRRLSPPER